MRTDPRLQTVIDHPLHQALGVRAIESQNGCGRMEFIAEGMTINPAGMLHGGVLYTLADVCAYAGLLSRLEPHQEAVTHDDSGPIRDDHVQNCAARPRGLLSGRRSSGGRQDHRDGAGDQNFDHPAKHLVHLPST